MIDEDITFCEKGYYSTELSRGSHKLVWAICEGDNCQREGGRGRWAEFRQYKKLCRKCVIKTRRVHKFDRCEVSTEKLSWVDDEKTFAEKGYLSTWLKPNSHMEVWRVCAGCGEGMWVIFRQCTELCHLCAHTNKEFRKKCSEGNIGKTRDSEACTRISESKKGKNNYWYGKKRSKEDRKKIGEPQLGENNHNWKGGVTPERKKFYSSFEYNEWRISVFERDDYTCQECDEQGVFLNVHHILPYRDYKDTEFSLNVDNGITLCDDCHNKTKGKEYEFVDKYQRIVNDKNDDRRYKHD